MDAIVEATLQVLLDKGVPGFNTTRVAERAGVSVGTLYQYFPNKQSLLLAIKARYTTQVMGAIHALIRGQIGRPLEKALKTIVLDVLRIKIENRHFTLVMGAAGASQLDNSTLRAGTRQLCEAMEALLRAAKPRLVDVRMKAKVLVSAIDGVIMAALAESPKLLEDKKFRDALVALALGFVDAPRPIRTAGAGPTLRLRTG